MLVDFYVWVVWILCVLCCRPKFNPVFGALANQVEMNKEELSTNDVHFRLYQLDDDDKTRIYSWQSLKGKYPKRLKAYANVGTKDKFELILDQNIELLTADYTESGPNGERVSTSRNLNDFCYYHGNVVGEKNSYAVLNVCNGQIGGTFHVDDRRFYVESSDDASAKVSIELDNNMDLLQSNKTCGFTNTEQTIRRRFAVGKRLRRSAADIPGYYSKFVKWDQLYVELAIVFDNSMYLKYNRDEDMLNDRAKRLVNYMNAFYQPVNIKIALVGVEVWSKGDIITVNNSGDTTLDGFHRYRKSHLSNYIRNDNAQLISNVPFNGDVVGKALKGTICSSEMSDAVVTDHSNRDIAVAATMAHELGHSFGMEHDNETCDCPSDRCIMAASSGTSAPLYWSTCSLEYLSFSLSHGGDFCLKNKPAHLFGSSAVCGNGFTEPGEDCDCGLADTCTNRCCNATTCKFADGALCASGECCDTNTCSMKPLATVCRSETNECDLAEFCDGKSETCPADVYRHDGLTCGYGKAYCYDGFCKSHDDQCKVIWGDTGTVADDLCFDLNQKGDPQGNCGLYRNNNSFVTCAEKDIECGLLHCLHKKEKTAFGDKPVVRYTSSIMRASDRREEIICQAALIDVGDDSKDPGFVPNGAKCGGNGAKKLCANRKCVDVASVLSKTYCTNDCNGVGICNNLGHCHCYPGYGGLDCRIPGLGGSVDSGPASLGTSFNVGLGILIFIFIAIPIVIIILTFLYKRKIIKAPQQMKILHTLFPSASRGPKRPKSAPIKTNFQSVPSKSPTHQASVNTTPKFSPMIPQLPKAAPQLTKAPPTSDVYYSKSRSTAPTVASVVASLPKKLDTSTSVSNPVGVVIEQGTLKRQPNSRPAVPAPPRPRRPDEQTMEQLYAEAPELAPVHNVDAQAQDSLLNDVLSAIGGQDGVEIVPHRRAPPPPEYSETNKYADVASAAAVAQKKKMFEAKDQPKDAKESVIRNVAATAISKPVNPMIGGEPTQQATSLTVVSRLENETLPRVNKAKKPDVLSATSGERRNSTDAKNVDSNDNVVPGPPPAKIKSDRLQRSVSSASSCGGVSRPARAPPPPPKPANLMLANEESYYDVIPSPSNERQAANRRNDEEDLYADIDEYRRDPKAEEQPPKKANGASSMVGKLAANFEATTRERSKSPMKK